MRIRWLKLNEYAEGPYSTRFSVRITQYVPKLPVGSKDKMRGITRWLKGSERQNYVYFFQPFFNFCLTCRYFHFFLFKWKVMLCWTVPKWCTHRQYKSMFLHRVPFFVLHAQASACTLRRNMMNNPNDGFTLFKWSTVDGSNEPGNVTTCCLASNHGYKQCRV